MDVASLIKDQKLEDAFDYIKSESNLHTLHAHILWAQIYETEEFDKSHIEFVTKDLSGELHETIRLYLFLKQIDWDTTKRERYKHAAKHIILEISNKLRTGFAYGYDIHPELLVHLQDLINIFQSENAFIDKADLSAVKAQISGTLLHMGYIEKYKFGSDMLQYAASYSFINYKEKAIEIYKALTKDFEPNSENTFKQVFPEITMINDFSKQEKYVYEKAQFELNKLNELSSVEPKKVILDEEQYFYEQATNTSENIKEELAIKDEQLAEETPSFLNRIKKFFK